MNLNILSALESLFKAALDIYISRTHNAGLSIVLLSFSVSLFLIPLFWIAEKLQEKTKKNRLKMQPDIEKISSLENSKEKYYYTKEIYRVHGFHPLQSLTSLIGLLIQIPFFIAAYRMLGNYEFFNGISLGPISDLSRPDGLLNGINLLPFLMTIANLSAGYLYSQISSKSDRRQLFVIAGLFLVLLYNQSSALVLYWTFNNIFAIGKNRIIDIIFRRPKKLISIKGDFSTIFRLIRNHYMTIILIFGFSFVAIYSANVLDSIIQFGTMRFLESIPASFFDNLWTIEPLVLSLDILIIIFLCYLDQIQRNIKSDNSKKIPLKSIFISIIIAHLLLVSLKIDFPSIWKFSDYATISLAIKEIILAIQATFLLLVFWINRKVLTIQNNENLKISDSILLLLPFSISINYYSSNIDLLSLWGSFFFVLVMLLIPILIYFVISRLFHRYILRNNLYVLVIASCSNYYIQPLIITSLGIDRIESLWILYFSQVLFSLILLVLYNTRKGTLNALIIGMFIASIWGVFFTGNDDRNNRLVNQAEGSEVLNYLSSNNLLQVDNLINRPNIYYLSYDAYVDELMMDFYGIDNSDHMNFLRENGFTIYEDIYTLGIPTLGALPNTLNMGNFTNSNPRRVMMGFNTTNEIFHSIGYETSYALLPHFTLDQPGIHNCSNIYPEIVQNDLLTSRFDGVKILLKNIVIGRFDASIENVGFGDTTNAELTDAKRNFILNAQSPHFVFSHSIRPGHGSPIAADRQGLEQSAIGFMQRLREANREMKDDIDLILRYDRNAIIIIAGDHGGFLEGSEYACDSKSVEEISGPEIADRYATFVAIKWPEDGLNRYDDINILQDIFFSVFSYLFQDPKIMEYRMDSTSSAYRGFEDGMIYNGVIQKGIDAGITLYDSVRNEIDSPTEVRLEEEYAALPQMMSYLGNWESNVLAYSEDIQSYYIDDNEALVVTAEGSDPYIIFKPFDIDSSGKIILNLDIISSETIGMQLYYSTRHNPDFSQDQIVTFIAKEGPNRILLDMPEGFNGMFRLDFLDRGRKAEYRINNIELRFQ